MVLITIGLSRLQKLQHAIVNFILFQGKPSSTEQHHRAQNISGRGNPDKSVSEEDKPTRGGRGRGGRKAQGPKKTKGPGKGRGRGRGRGASCTPSPKGKAPTKPDSHDIETPEKTSPAKPTKPGATEQAKASPKKATPTEKPTVPKASPKAKAKASAKKSYDSKTKPKASPKAKNVCKKASGTPEPGAAGDGSTGDKSAARKRKWYSEEDRSFARRAKPTTDHALNQWTAIRDIFKSDLSLKYNSAHQDSC